MSQHAWPAHLPVGAFRFARPSADLEACTRFYRDAVGLSVLAEFRGHAGYDGAVFGLPDSSAHLELTRQAGDGRVPEPSPENQLVLYLPDADAVAGVVARLAAFGHAPVEPANGYWSDRGAVAFEDPDRWVVVFAPWIFGAQ
ncbi:MAG TPA: VOC family protein [Actinocrinis sp.]|nr:VOC family protein [Actinocrinis sp.]